jgi:hypothetical protein
MQKYKYCEEEGRNFVRSCCGGLEIKVTDKE